MFSFHRELWCWCWNCRMDLSSLNYAADQNTWSEWSFLVLKSYEFTAAQKNRGARALSWFFRNAFLSWPVFSQCCFLLCSIYPPDFPFWNYIRNSNVLWHCSKPGLVRSFPGVSMTLSLECQGDIFTMAAHSSLSTSWSNLSEGFFNLLLGKN